MFCQYRLSNQAVNMEPEVQAVLLLFLWVVAEYVEGKRVRREETRQARQGGQRRKKRRIWAREWLQRRPLYRMNEKLLE